MFELNQLECGLIGAGMTCHYIDTGKPISAFEQLAIVLCTLPILPFIAMFTGSESLSSIYNGMSINNRVISCKD